MCVIYKVKLDRASHAGTRVYVLGDHISDIFVQACYQRLGNLSTVVRWRRVCVCMTQQPCSKGDPA